MFGKLKSKLQDALSVFSKKTEEEAEDIPQEEVNKIITKSKVKVSDKIIKETPSQKKKKETKDSDKENSKKKIKKSKIDEKVKENLEKKESTKEEALEEKEVIEEEKEEVEVKKKGFFGKLFSKKEKVVAEQKQDKKKLEEKEIKKEKEKKKEKSKRETKEKEESKEIKKVEDEKLIKEVKESKEEEPEEKKRSLFGRVKESLTTKTISSEKFEKLFWNLELALLENNVSVEVIEKIKTDLNEELVDKPLPRDVPKKILTTLKNSLNEVLSNPPVNLIAEISKKQPFVIAMFGINGTGKTTSVAKLTHYLQQQNKSVVLAACDTFRAAAIQQLKEHAEKLNVPMIKHDYGSDAAAVAFDAVKYAEKNKIDVVLIDTAGRLHSNTNLMAELEKIIRVTKPDLKIFVGESITGNDCIEQARKFNELVEMDGAILTKADVDEKGGAPLSISYIIKKPILFLGVGQNYEDLITFDKEKILEQLGL